MRYRDSDRVLGALGQDAFAAGVEDRVRRLHASRLELAATQARLAAHTFPAVPELRAQWPDLEALERRQILRGLIDCVLVAPGRLNVQHRVTICPRGTAPAYKFRGVAPDGTALPLKPRR